MKKIIARPAAHDVVTEMLLTKAFSPFRLKLFFVNLKCADSL